MYLFSATVLIFYALRTIPVVLDTANIVGDVSAIRLGSV